MNLKFIFLFFSLIINIRCYIIIPLTYFQAQSNKDNSPKSTILSILDLNMYGILEIGTPKQICHIPINFGSNTFFIPEKESFDFDIKDNINLYDNRNSSTFNTIEDEDTYEGENFIDAYYVNDIIYFGKEEAYLDFYLSLSYYYPKPGGLGLQLYPSSRRSTATPDPEKSFLRKIKLNRLANNYIWTIFYDYTQIKYGEIIGYILIGDYPHLSINYPDENIYNFSLYSIDAEIYNKKIIETKFMMHNAQIIKNENILVHIAESFFVTLDYNFGGIIAPEKMGLYFENNIFNNLKFCHKEVLSRISTNIFYYCDNSEENIKQIKKIFPKIKFVNKILNSSFIINIDDLLYIKENFVYLLLIFEEGSDQWTLGVPFLQKYPFSINEDSKRIYFYKKIEIASNKIMKTNERNYFYILIIALSIFFIIFGLIIGIVFCYKNSRRKRKNELDDDFDYSIKGEENNSIIN